MPVKSPQAGDLDPIETASRDEISALQLERLQWSVRHTYDNVEAYRKLLAKEPSIVDLLAQPDAGDIDFEPVRIGGSLFRPADLA